jgi:hypothetical protein
MNLFLLLAAWKNAKGFDRTKKSRVAGIARAGGFLAVAALGIGLFATHGAKADMAKASLKFGREVAPLAQDGANEVRLNGQSFFLREAGSSAPVKDILDEFETRCNAQKGALGELWAKVPEHATSKGKTMLLPSSMRSGILRANEGVGEGAVMCLVKGERSSGGLSESLQNFAKSQDLGDLGKLRYVYARAGKDGRTRVVTAWTEESFSFKAIGAPDGDPPGGDTALPKPEGARRFMNAEVIGTPFGIRLYEVQQSPEEVVGFYDKWAAAGNFRGIAPEHPDGEMRAYFRETTQILVTANRSPSGSTVLSISEISAEKSASGTMAEEK